MPVHVGMLGAFGSAGATKRDANGQLRFEQLPMARLIGARHDVAGGVAHRAAIEVEANAGDKTRYVALGQAGIGAGGAGFHAIEAGVDAAAHRVGVSRLFGMRSEQGADGDGGHGSRLPCGPCMQTRKRWIGSESVEAPLNRAGKGFGQGAGA
jgi:hypothetical protein